MSVATRRQERVGELLQRELAELIAFEVKDPRLADVSVTRVSVTADLRTAHVYVSTLDDDPASHAATLAALQRAGGYLRRRLGERVVLRYLPDLRFHYDEGVAASLRIEALIQRAVGETEEQ